MLRRVLNIFPRTRLFFRPAYSRARSKKERDLYCMYELTQRFWVLIEMQMQHKSKRLITSSLNNTIPIRTLLQMQKNASLKLLSNLELIEVLSKSFRMTIGEKCMTKQVQLIARTLAMRISSGALMALGLLGSMSQYSLTLQRCLEEEEEEDRMLGHLDNTWLSISILTSSKASTELTRYESISFRLQLTTRLAYAILAMAQKQSLELNL